MDAILLIGIQGAGKSTFCRERFFDTHVRISLDLLRTRNRERRLLEFCIETRQSFVVDKTNHTAEQRARYIGPARAAGFRIIGYYFAPDAWGSYERNRQRARPVPAAGVFGTLRQLEPPGIEEGFDCLVTVKLGANGEFLLSDWPPAHAPHT